MFKLIKEGCKFGVFLYISKEVFDVLTYVDHRFAKKLLEKLPKEGGSQE